MDRYTLTKMDLAALRQADDLCVHLTGDAGRVRAIKRRSPTEKNPFADDIEHIIAAPVTDHKAASMASRKYFAMVGLFGRSHARSIIAMLRAGDEIVFTFYPDAHRNQYMEKAELHGDVLYLRVTRGKQRFEFELEHSNCPDNSARMCKGYSAEYSLVA